MSDHLFIISGPSGVGKTVILERIRRMMPRLGRIVTYTTREPRPKERNGIHYHFVTQRHFKEMIEDHAFLEWAVVHTHLYGTPKMDVLTQLKKGTAIAMIVDVQGAMRIKEQVPETQLIFIEPDDPHNLIKHLHARKEMTDKEMKLRLETAKHELDMRDYYDYVVVNKEGRIEQTVKDVALIIQNLMKRGQDQRHYHPKSLIQPLK